LRTLCERPGRDGRHSSQSRSGGVLPADQLAEYLSGTQFLYLSSCRSADAYFVLNLVDQRVPAVLGFRWPVQDEGAHAYAKSFYDTLFNDALSRKFIEYAFLKAKRKQLDLNQQDPTWASPVLVMQVTEPEEEEMPTSSRFGNPR
jgi:hypothetical protein